MWEFAESSLDRSRRSSRQSGRSVYRQIANHLQGEIERRGIEPGERLPPIRQLASHRGVSRDTVALAHEALATAGFVESTVGRGTFGCASLDPVLAPSEPIDLELAEAPRRSRPSRNPQSLCAATNKEKPE